MQGKGSTSVSHANPQPPDRQASDLLTVLILPRLVICTLETAEDRLGSCLEHFQNESGARAVH